jgi:hypothetical protein
VKGTGNNTKGPILCLCDSEMEATTLGSTVQLKTRLIVMMGRGPELVSVEDPGLNSPLHISYIIPGLRGNIIGKDEVH